MKLITSSAVYFAIVFGAGFVFGTVRVIWWVPTVGVRVAELTALPLMLAVAFFAAGWLNRRFLAERDQSSRLIVGVTALVFLLLAELISRVAFIFTYYRQRHSPGVAANRPSASRAGPNDMLVANVRTWRV